MPIFTMIHNLVDPNDPMGRTYKEVNAGKAHKFPIGALVEDQVSGVRLFVVGYARDCDMTPLYTLSPYHPKEENEYKRDFKRLHGYDEETLVVIKKDGYYERD